MQVARLRVALVLSGNAVRGEEESAACCGNGEEDAIAAAEMRRASVSIHRVRRKTCGSSSYLRKDIVVANERCVGGKVGWIAVAIGAEYE